MDVGDVVTALYEGCPAGRGLWLLPPADRCPPDRSGHRELDPTDYRRHRASCIRTLPGRCQLRGWGRPRAVVSR